MRRKEVVHALRHPEIVLRVHADRTVEKTHLLIRLVLKILLFLQLLSFVIKLDHLSHQI
jgi:hypothetical protein